jgi:hypothetical protein
MVRGAGCQESRFRSSLRDPGPGVRLWSDQKVAHLFSSGISPYDCNYSLDNHFGGFEADGIILQSTSSWSEIEKLYLGSCPAFRGRLLARNQ